MQSIWGCVKAWLMIRKPPAGYAWGVISVRLNHWLWLQSSTVVNEDGLWHSCLICGLMNRAFFGLSETCQWGQCGDPLGDGRETKDLIYCTSTRIYMRILKIVWVHLEDSHLYEDINDCLRTVMNVRTLKIVCGQYEDSDVLYSDPQTTWKGPWRLRQKWGQKGDLGGPWGMHGQRGLQGCAREQLHQSINIPPPGPPTPCWHQLFFSFFFLLGWDAAVGHNAIIPPH